MNLALGLRGDRASCRTCLPELEASTLVQDTLTSGPALLPVYAADAGAPGARATAPGWSTSRATSGSTPTAATRSPRPGIRHPDGRAGDRRAGGEAALLLDRGAAPDPRAAGRAARVALSRSARPGCSSATRARRPTRTRSRWRGSAPAGSNLVSVRGRMARPYRRRRSPAPTGRATRKRARRAGVPLSTQGRRSTTSRRLEAVVDRLGGRGDRRAGAGPRRARATARPSSSRRPARDLHPSAVRCSSSTRSSAASAAAAPSRAAEAFGVVARRRSRFAKGLAAGLPIGRGHRTRGSPTGLAIGDLGSTFGGGPVRLRRGARQPRRDRARGTDRQRDRDRRAASRRRARARRDGGCSGRGLLLGLHLDRPAAEVQKALFAHRDPDRHRRDPAGASAPAAALILSAAEADLLLAALGRGARDDQARLPRAGGLESGRDRRAARRSPRGSSGARCSGGLERKVLAMVFLDPSLRTRTSFETAMFLHGGHARDPGAGQGELVARDRDRRRHGWRPRSSTSSRPRACSAATPTRSAVRTFPRGTDWAVARARTGHPELRALLREAGHQPRVGAAPSLPGRWPTRSPSGEAGRDRAARSSCCTWAWHPKALPTAVPASARARGGAAGHGDRHRAARRATSSIPRTLQLDRRARAARGGEFGAGHRRPRRRDRRRRRGLREVVGIARELRPAGGGARAPRAATATGG